MSAATPVKVYGNRVCHVDRLPYQAGFRVVITASGKQLGAFADSGELGWHQAIQLADSHAGPPKARR